MIIHKREVNGKFLDERTWTACDPKKSFSEYKSPEFIKWSEENKYHWKVVTCEKCLASPRKRRR